LFDHSCGHDKNRADGLIVENMKKYYGGKQPKMRDTKSKVLMDTWDSIPQYCPKEAFKKCLSKKETKTPSG
jgi:hypothetical protein